MLTLGINASHDFSVCLWKDKNIYNFDHYNYQCIPGRLILFKSYTKHGYDSHLNEKDKIGIAFNYGRVQ
jgi:hypothetical protein